jgi:hypothetical protein
MLGRLLFRIALAFAFAIVVAGSASAEGMRDGTGAKRVYRESYESTFNAVLVAARARQLEVVEADESAGKIALSRAGNWSNWGERVQVLVTPLADGFTEVEILSTPRLEFLSYSPDWARILFKGTDDELREPID